MRDCSSQLASTTIVSRHGTVRNGRRKKRPMATPMSSRPSTVLNSYKGDCSMTQGSPLPTTSRLSFLPALTPTSAICRSKFYRKPIHYIPRTFQMPSCALQLLPSDRVIIYDRRSRDSWLGSRWGRGSTRWEGTHLVRI
jgi:hypothetical protein